jgi:hypothetical protein
VYPEQDGLTAVCMLLAPLVQVAVGAADIVDIRRKLT